MTPVRLRPLLLGTAAVLAAAHVPTLITPPSLIAAPLPALAATIELTAYALLAVGLPRAGRHGQVVTNSPH